MGCASSVRVAPADAEGADIVPRMPPDAPGKEVTATWLNSALRAGKKVRPSVRSVEVLPVVAPMADGTEREDGGGISGSRIVRLRLSFDGPDGLPSGGDTMIMKWVDFRKVPGLPIVVRCLVELSWGFAQSALFRSEHTFYSEFWPAVADCGIRIPAVYWEGLRDATDPCQCCRLACDRRAAIFACSLQEDMCPPGGRGPRFRSMLPFQDVGRWRAALALRNVAKLHRATWRDLGRFRKMFEPLWGGDGSSRLQISLYGPRGTAGWKDKGGFAKLNVDKLVRTWEAGLGQGVDGFKRVEAVMRDPAFKAALQRLQAVYDKLRPALGAAEPQCVVHGDFHHWNNMFAEEDGEDAVRLIDWQACGFGRVAYEVVYFLCTSVDAAGRDEDEVLLKAYFESFTQSGGLEGYSYDDFRRECDLAVVDAASMQVFTLTKVTPKLMRNMLRRPKIRDVIVSANYTLERAFRRLMCTPLESLMASAAR